MRTKKSLIFLLFSIALALVVGEYAYVPSNFTMPGSRIMMVGLTLSTTNIAQGSPIDISITMRNDGTASAIANAEVAIYDQSNSLMENITFDPVTVAPSQTVALTKTWNSDSKLPGLYRAVAKANYDGNDTNSLNQTFTIFIPIPPSGGPPETRFVPIILPPEIKPVRGEIQFIKNTVLKEVLAGEGGVESLTLKNTGEKNLTVKIELNGVPYEWIGYQPNTTVMMPGETRVINLQIAVPKNTPSGNYLVRFDAASEGTYSQDFLALRVKNYPENYDKPIAIKTIKVDNEEKKTEILIDVKNPSKNRMKLVTLTEKIPLPLLSSAIEFMDKQGSVSEVNGEKLVEWEFSDLAPLEEAHLSYTLGNFLTEYSTYANWHISQIATTEKIELADLIKILDVTTQMQDENFADVTANIMYVGVDPINVTMLLEVPEGFVVEPGTITTTLIPKGMSYAKFLMKIPKTSQETHLIRFVILGDKVSLFATSPVIIRKPVAPPSFSLMEVLGVNQIVILSSLIAAGVAGVLLTYRRRRGTGPVYDHDRVVYMKNIKRMITKK